MIYKHPIGYLEDALKLYTVTYKGMLLAYISADSKEEAKILVEDKYDTKSLDLSFQERLIS